MHQIAKKRCPVSQFSGYSVFTSSCYVFSDASVVSLPPFFHSVICFSAVWILHFWCMTHTSVFIQFVFDRRMNAFCILICCFFLSCSSFFLSGYLQCTDRFLANLFCFRSKLALTYICHSIFRFILTFSTDFRLHRVYIQIHLCTHFVSF